MVLQRRDDDLVVGPPGWLRPQLCATRLMASVVPRMKMISRVEAALRKRRTRSRAPSKASVASWLKRVHAAMHVGMQMGLVVVHRIDHRLRALRGGAVVQVGQGLAH